MLAPSYHGRMVLQTVAESQALQLVRRMRMEKTLLYTLVPLIPAAGLVMLYNIAARSGPHLGKPEPMLQPGLLTER